MPHWDDPFGFHKSMLFPSEPRAASVISTRNCLSIIVSTDALCLKCISRLVSQVAKTAHQVLMYTGSYGEKILATKPL
jgi:hypothetical protein